jgi:hypothetical protein
LASHAFDPAAQDDGSAAPGVAAALSAYASGVGGPADVIAALSAGRLLVPVVAVLDEADADGSEKASHMATVLTTGKDGRRGLLAFTSTESMRTWNPSARPLPVPTRRAAESALADGADALVVDIAGPVMFSVDAAELRALSSGWRPVSDEHGGAAWAVAVGLAGPGERPADQPEDGTGANVQVGDGAPGTAGSGSPPRAGSAVVPRADLVKLPWRLARATAEVLASRVAGALKQRRR